MSNLQKVLLSRGSKKLVLGAKDCTPVAWTKYFRDQKDVYIGNNKFHIYVIGTDGPLLLALHGGGYSALTWSLFTEEIMNKIKCQLIAIDLRGHGCTETDDDQHLSLETMANDVADVLKSLYGKDVPPVVLVGHSMGGAIAVEAASLIDSIIGLCVIDVVEGTALESLSSMQCVLRGRPSSFKSVEHAIQWSYRGGQTHNLEAARVSMPGQIINVLTGELAANELNCPTPNTEEVKLCSRRIVHQRSVDAIEEEAEEDDSKSQCNDVEYTKLQLPSKRSFDYHFASPTAITPYVWRIDLSKTESFWSGWFRGLSQKFLDVRVPKILLLANIQGLDTTLTVGQMQGKFQLQVLQRSGHAIHEDQPHRVADIIAGFLVKQRLANILNGFTPSMPAC